MLAEIPILISALASMLRAQVIPAERGIVEAYLPSHEKNKQQFLPFGDGKCEATAKDLILDMSKYPDAYEAWEAHCMMILCFGAPWNL